jgi:hypothetical protein
MNTLKKTRFLNEHDKKNRRHRCEHEEEPQTKELL